MSITVPCIDYRNKQESTVTACASHRQSIVTKYHGPTNTKGSRLAARCAAKRIVVAYDYELNAGENHAAAAAALAAAMGWSGKLIGGQCADSSMCFVFVD